MDLVGNDWLNLTQQFAVPDGQLPDTTLSGGTATSTIRRTRGRWAITIRPTCRSITNWQRSSPPATPGTHQFRRIPCRTACICSPPPPTATRFPPTDPNDPAWQRPTFFRALTNAGITWRYYYQDNSVFLANWADWNDPQIQGNVRNIQEYYNILASPNADTEPAAGGLHRAGQRNRPG